MKTPRCRTADDRGMAITDEAREELHDQCPGAYRTPDGELRRCECSCHPPQADLTAAAKKRLPVLAEPPRGDGPGAGPSDRKRAEKRSKTGTCCHCGAPTGGGEFAPGHDAKLKSELQRAASGEWGDVYAWAEIVVRGWEHIVKSDDVADGIRKRGAELARTSGRALLADRNAMRRSQA